MLITLNGTETDIEHDTTVAALLAREGLAEKPCAVEVNRAIIRKPDHDSHTLTEGDAVEIVTLVGGG
jgi:thiamine biosynthesis protein ThiS